MTFKDIQLEREGGTAIVTLNRPERRNALSLQMLQELTDCFRRLREDAEVRVAVLRANGPVFSAGHDLSEMIGRGGAFFASSSPRAIWRSPRRRRASRLPE